MKNKFPLKKSITGTILILLISLIILGLLYAIIGNITNQQNLWIIFVIWGGALLLGLIAYWIYQIKSYRKNEKK